MTDAAHSYGRPDDNAQLEVTLLFKGVISISNISAGSERLDTFIFRQAGFVYRTKDLIVVFDNITIKYGKDSVGQKEHVGVFTLLLYSYHICLTIVSITG